MLDELADFECGRFDESDIHLDRLAFHYNPERDPVGWHDRWTTGFSNSSGISFRIPVEGNTHEALLEHVTAADVTSIVPSAKSLPSIQTRPSPGFFRHMYAVAASLKFGDFAIYCP